MSNITLLEVYQAQFNRLKDRHDACTFDLSCLFEHVFGVRRYSLYLAESEPADEEKARIFSALCDRYDAGEPLQYLLGEWGFYGLMFDVGPGVLIPRPDTETLIETALAKLVHTPVPRIVELGAGSGCISITLAKQRADAQILAMELSDEAIPYLRRNVKRHSAGNVTIRQHDMLSPPHLPSLDLVVSNPPYISKADMQSLQEQVRHEPEMALYGGEDGLDFYRQIPKIYLPILKEGGWLIFEVGYDQAAAVGDILMEQGYHDIQIDRDLAGIPRVVSGQK